MVFINVYKNNDSFMKIRFTWDIHGFVGGNIL